MIEKIRIQNFKSLADVTLNLSKFTCFVGMNGAGKSSILQALDFLSQQMRGNISEWFEQRGWAAKDIGYKGLHAASRSASTSFEVHYRLADGSLIHWAGVLSRTRLQIASETAILVSKRHELLLRTVADSYQINGSDFPSAFNYEGSILSQLKDEQLPGPLLEFRNALANIQSLELLSPGLLRRSSRAQDRSIGTGGEMLSGFLDTIRGNAKDRLIGLLNSFYPSFVDFKIVTAKGGWKRLVAIERRGLDRQSAVALTETAATHLNDGLLRILAILAQLEAGSFSVLLLDEVEDGINPEIMERLVDTLVSSKVQVIVTTHSPMILNYLSDDIARSAIQFVYKWPSGETRVRPFFSIRRVNDKLAYMGPGEAFIDTHLDRLTDECIDADNGKDVENDDGSAERRGTDRPRTVPKHAG